MRISFPPIAQLIKVAFVVILALGTQACESEAPTTPSGTGIPVTESFTGTLQPNGEAFYAFSMSKAGPVSLTLVSMIGSSVPADALFPVGIGSPVGQFCSAGTDAAIGPGATPQFTAGKDIGVYCVRITDNARLGAAATFVLNITHPK